MSSYADETVEKWKSLIDRLAFYTSQNKIKWKTSADENTFLARIGENQVSVSGRPNALNWQAWDFSIRIFNASGDVVDEFSDEDVDGYYKKIKSMYDTIVRRNNGSEDVLNAILKALPDPDETPF